MLGALVAGERDPEVLAGLGDKRLRASRGELEEALTGRFTEHHGFLVAAHLRVIDSLDAEVRAVEERIQEFFDESDPDRDGPAGLSGADRADWARKRELLGTIPGVSNLVAEQVLAEIGTDMSVFPSAKNLVSWAGAAPGLNRSAGRSKPAKAPRGNRFLKGALGVAALAVARRPGTFLHARYKRVCLRAGPQKALVAVENTMLTAIWHILTKNEPYKDPGEDYYLRRRPGAAIRKSVHSLKAIGYEVAVAANGTITATPAPA
jgi:transposase